MLLFRPTPLTEDEIGRLARRTEPFLSEDYSAQVDAVDPRWGNARLGSIRDKAMAARPRADRCVYCEDDQGRELDHLRPKTLHPWLAFCWDNLIPACGTCGGMTHKGAKDAILDATPTGYREITRPRGHAPTPPPDGPTAWWNPRLADPMSVFELDLVDRTFRFQIIAPAGSPAYARADWTLKTLGLNTRANLVAQRRVAYNSYLRLLQDVRAALQVGDAPKLRACQTDLPHMNHPTVWAEMKRQRDRLPALADLFDAYPPALGW